MMKEFDAEAIVDEAMEEMDEEFEEIKTNILRTAGKMDSLRSKLPMDDEVEWKMMNDLEAVDFPASEIEIESIIETEVPIDVESLVVEETPAEEPVIEALPVEEVVEEVEAFTLEDLTAPDSIIPEAAPVEEISFEDFDIELPDLTEAAPEEVVEEPAEEVVEEISFEGLEELFKED